MTPRLHTSTPLDARKQPPIEARSEVWKVVPSNPKYEVSTLGRVRNKASRHIHKPSRDQDGYLLTAFSGVTVKVHRIVCETFHGPCPVGMICAHNDAVKDNNRPDNLRWATYKENSADMQKHGTVLRGSSISNSKLTEDDVAYIWLNDHISNGEMAKVFNISPHTIGNIRRRETWVHVTNRLPNRSSRSEHQNTKIPIPNDFYDVCWSLSYKELTARFGVGVGTISRWKHARSKDNA